MEKIPQKLVDSLVELGLLESEARIYSALIIFHCARIRDLQEHLDLSRPSIYAGLRSLDKRGLVDLICAKPATYQAIPPELAMDILTIMHRNSKETALALFHSIEKENHSSDSSPGVWSYIEKDDFEAKIKEMLSNAQDSVFCLTFGDYIDLIEAKAKSSLDFHIVIISEDHAIQERLEPAFKKYKARVQTIKKSRFVDMMINNFPSIKPEDGVHDKDVLAKKIGLFSLDSMFVLDIDDRECFIIPPMPPDSINGGMVTKERSLILYQKLIMKMIVNTGPRS